VDEGEYEALPPSDVRGRKHVWTLIVSTGIAVEVGLGTGTQGDTGADLAFKFAPSWVLVPGGAEFHSQCDNSLPLPTAAPYLRANSVECATPTPGAAASTGGEFTAFFPNAHSAGPSAASNNYTFPKGKGKSKGGYPPHPQHPPHPPLPPQLQQPLQPLYDPHQDPMQMAAAFQMQMHHMQQMQHQMAFMQQQMHHQMPQFPPAPTKGKGDGRGKWGPY